MESSKLEEAQRPLSPQAPTAPTKPPTQAVSARTIGRILMALLILLILVGSLPNVTLDFLGERFQTFTTIFLGIFIEAVPFLLAGSLVSGFLEKFVSDQTLARLIPRRTVPAAFVGSLLGFVFPVCECGVVPVTRRLYQKGMPLSVGVAFLLSAPVINPIVLVSTYVAFGVGPVLAGRFAFTILIAFLTGILFHFARPQEILKPPEERPLRLEQQLEFRPNLPLAAAQSSASTGSQRAWEALVVAGDDFMDMARYLIIGCMLAATMQTFVPQSTLLAFGSDAVTSVVALMALAFVLSICSTVDAFLALSFAGTFTTGAILSFLVFGPMVDIKSALMFLSIFRRRTVLYLILVPMMLTLLVSVYINLNVGW